MKVFDCFTFFNELELLELRLSLLNDVVDYFVLVEANINFAGKPKELLFNREKDRYSDYMHKIIHVKLEDVPTNLPFGGVEVWQRDQITRGVTAADGDDRIIVSDVDELINPQLFPKILSLHAPAAFQQHLFYYHVNCMQRQVWPGPVILTTDMMPVWGGNPEAVRRLRYGAGQLPAGGWHYSHLGDARRNRERLDSVVEHRTTFGDVLYSDEELQKIIDTQQDLYSRKDNYAQKELVNIFTGGRHPPGLLKWLKKYPQFYFGELEEE